MARLIFITHPEVLVDADVDSRKWRLSPQGQAQVTAFANSPVVAGVTAVWASTETKGIETAGILSAALGVGMAMDAGLGEFDRTATGFLQGEDFEVHSAAFYAEPGRSICGWERAVDAQSRIAATVGRIVQGHSGGDIAIVSHGVVGSLLLSRLAGEPISREARQSVRGSYWSASLPELVILHRWHPMNRPM